MLGRDELVLERRCLTLGRLEGAHELARRARLGGRRAADLWKLVQGGVHEQAHVLRRGAGLPQNRGDDSAFLLEQHREQVLGRDLRIPATVRQALGSLDRLLGLDRELVWLHIPPQARPAPSEPDGFSLSNPLGSLEPDGPFFCSIGIVNRLASRARSTSPGGSHRTSSRRYERWTASICSSISRSSSAACSRSVSSWVRIASIVSSRESTRSTPARLSPNSLVSSWMRF